VKIKLKQLQRMRNIAKQESRKTEESKIGGKKNGNNKTNAKNTWLEDRRQYRGTNVHTK
jgi:hypothetical protein